MKTKCILLILLLPANIIFSQDLLEFREKPKANEGYTYAVRKGDAASASKREETKAEKQRRISVRFGDSAAAITLVEEAEENRKTMESSDIRKQLKDAEQALEKIETTRISQKKRQQLAQAWTRLAHSEQKLFGDTSNHLAWLRIAADLDPDNEEAVRALDNAERKHEIMNARLTQSTANN